MTPRKLLALCEEAIFKGNPDFMFAYYRETDWSSSTIPCPQGQPITSRSHVARTSYCLRRFDPIALRRYLLNCLIEQERIHNLYQPPKKRKPLLRLPKRKQLN